MLKIFFKNLGRSVRKITFIAFSVSVLMFLVKQSFAQNLVSTTEAINQIEKVLSAPKGSIILNRKSEFTIDRGAKEESSEASIEGEEEEPKIFIEVLERRDSKANRLKEKLAYNATLAGQYEAAAELYRQILKTEPGNDYASFGLGTSYHKLKQYKQAKQIYYKLLGRDINNKDEVIGNFLEILVQESPKDSRYVLARLSAQSPNSDFILARSALTYEKINKRDDAILLLKRAIAINPNNPQYQLNLAIILDKNDESAEALKYYKSVLRAFVGSGQANQKVDLASIRKRITFIENNS